MLQDEVFKISEADNWFLRNKDVIISKKVEDDVCVNLINCIPDKAKIRSILELGSSNGYRLNFLKKLLPDCQKFVGVDLSKAAVEDGKSRYNLEMYCDALLNFKSNEPFDLVIVNFVLHWIDRKNIFECISNIDRLVSSEIGSPSLLCLGDFLPDFPYKRFYHHLPDNKIYTYKTDYKKAFMSLNTYKLIDEQTYNCDCNSKIADNSNRASVSLLKKNLCEYYYEL